MAIFGWRWWVRKGGGEFQKDKTKASAGSSVSRHVCN